MGDALDLGSSGVTRGGSSPPLRICKGEELKIEYTDVDQVKVEANVRFEDKEWEEVYRDILIKNSKEIQIPGFRKGKVPVNIVETRLKDYLRLLTGEELIKKSLFKIKEDFGKRFAGGVKIEDFKIEDREAKLSFEVVPDFELKDYEYVEIEEPEMDDPEVIIEEMIEKEREKNKEYISSGEPAKIGDMVLGDTLFYEKETGRRIFPWIKNMRYILGDESLYPQITDALEGVTPGKEVRVFIEYPPEHSIKELAGKSVGIKIKVKEVKTPRLPEVDDRFAQMLGYANLEDMKNKLKERVNIYLDEEKKRKTENLILAKLVDDHDFTVPESLLLEEVEKVVREYGIKITDENREEVYSIARRRVMLDIILNRLADKESIEVTEEEIKEEIKKYSALYNIPEDIFYKESVMSGRIEAIVNALRKSKVIENLMKKVRYVK